VAKETRRDLEERTEEGKKMKKRKPAKKKHQCFKEVRLKEKGECVSERKGFNQPSWGRKGRIQRKKTFGERRI